MQPVHPYRALILDYGAVICHAPSQEDLNRYLHLTGLSFEDFRAIYITTREQLDRGRMNSIDYWALFGERAGKSFSATTIAELAHWDVAAWAKVNPRVVEIADELRSNGMKTAILSNMQPDLLAWLRGNVDWIDRFDEPVFSCEVGLVKPETAAYQCVLDRLGVAPEQAIFVDDLKHNIAAAEELGIRGLLYKSCDQLEAELGELLRWTSADKSAHQEQGGFKGE